MPEPSSSARIDALILKVKESIDKLREYRTAIISAAVTGKIDMREKPLPHTPACGSPEMPWKYEQHKEVYDKIREEKQAIYPQ